MVIALSNSFTHNACNKASDLPNKEIENVVVQKLQNMGISKEEVCWNKNGHLEVKSSNSMKIHTLLLQMEQLGLNVKLTKQTLIEIA